ncbi:BZ3500_MvSof-1268-A1-R1_Chr5-3g08178 [Microbotryum saponariae]|uniref:BZ3500_MvSof-1268-A1-R1_Chr5-3g08178 protein n=1 Tax=Microbotryum saponariae TaxID=289078 RepID=A0A2X0L7Z6_9BASI|nr:BZ3500_MvSof-1268-A1-R1_Chr5-3g08178 [Microbotryum saponariae]SDA07937.1 BZ3501_MvSof-1269-A2-R1_Chr5-1g07322 [Microbotryum saponariae]
MARKSSSSQPNAHPGTKSPAVPTASTPVASRDVLQRLNYLYQASTLLGRSGSGMHHQEGTSRSKRKHKKKGEARKGSDTTGMDVATARFLPTQPSAGVAAVQHMQPPLSSTSEPNPSQPTTTATSKARDPSQAKHASTGTDHHTVRDRQRRRRSAISEETTPQQSGMALHAVSCSLAGLMNLVAQKATVKMDPSLKRTVCKTCRSVLVAGMSSSVRVKREPFRFFRLRETLCLLTPFVSTSRVPSLPSGSGPHGHRIVHTCLACRTTRKLPAPPIRETSPVPTSAHANADILSTTSTSVASVASVASPPSMEAIIAENSPLPPPPPTKKKNKILTAKEERRLREPVFFERKDHVTIPGTRV